MTRSLDEKKVVVVVVVGTVIEKTVNEEPIVQGKLLVRTMDEKTVVDESVAKNMANKKIGKWFVVIKQSRVKDMCQCSLLDSLLFLCFISLAMLQVLRVLFLINWNTNYLELCQGITQKKEKYITQKKNNKKQSQSNKKCPLL